MRRYSRALIATALSLGIAAAAIPSQAAAFDSTELKCRSMVRKAGNKYARTILKVLGSCHRVRDDDGSLSSRNCNDISGADTKHRIHGSNGARSKLHRSINDKCASNVPTSSILFEECPEQCRDDDTPPITMLSSLNACLTCLAEDETESFSDVASGRPDSPIASPAEATCHGSITGESNSLFHSVMKDVARCQSKLDRNDPGNTAACTETGFAALTDDDYADCIEALEADCAAVALPSATLDACGGAVSASQLASCACGAARDQARALASYLISLPGAPTTTTTTSTTTTTTYTTTTSTLPVGDPTCPDLRDVVLYSRDSNIACTTNGDCIAPRTCNGSICTTVSDLDLGWSGYGHGEEMDDGVRIRTRLHCPGPGPVCGECNVIGIDPEPRNCRCLNDARTICDQPMAAHADDCGGGACVCYYGAPYPISTAAPLCVVNRLSQNITGTVNVDTGAEETSAGLLVRVHLGESVYDPCPVCGGKCSDNGDPCRADADCALAATCLFDTPNDGTRDGICQGGASPGLACDAMGSSPSFPTQTGGGSYSLDCMPATASNFSGQGLRVELGQTTGSVSLGAGLDCDGSGEGTELCPCKVCSQDPKVACSADADCQGQSHFCSGVTSPATIECDTDPDCASVDLGTCTLLGNTRCSQAINVECHGNDSECQDVSIGTCIPSTCSVSGAGVVPAPNSCDNGSCSDLGGSNGQCTTGPDDSYCDGITTAAGDGIVLCNADIDCTPAVIGEDGGSCTHVTRRPCFTNPITAVGSPHPVHPVTVDAFCMPPTASNAINTINGLPGPGRRVTQGTATSWCASNQGTAYTPGAGGCP